MKYFFTFTLPEWFDKFKDWIKNGNRIFVTGFFLIMLSLPIVGYQTYMTYQYNKMQAADNKIKQTGDTPKEHKIVTDGARKYLRDVLMVKSDIKVQELFDENAKYHGQYQNVVKQASTYKNVKDLRAYLNPIVSALQNGQNISETKIKHDFTLVNTNNGPYQGATQSEMQDGVMTILWDSKADDAQEQANIIDQIIRKSDYTVKVFDKASKSGIVNFNQTAESFLNMGDKIRAGFDEHNSYTGVAYGFKNGLFVFHTKTLKGIPTKMPETSIADPDIKPVKRNNDIYKDFN